jgi:hypothetical protein
MPPAVADAAGALLRRFLPRSFGGGSSGGGAAR